MGGGSIPLVSPRHVSAACASTRGSQKQRQGLVGVRAAARRAGSPLPRCRTAVQDQAPSQPKRCFQFPGALGPETFGPALRRCQERRLGAATLAGRKRALRPARHTGAQLQAVRRQVPQASSGGGAALLLGKPLCSPCAGPPPRPLAAAAAAGERRFQHWAEPAAQRGGSGGAPGRQTGPPREAAVQSPPSPAQPLHTVTFSTPSTSSSSTGSGGLCRMTWRAEMSSWSK